MTEANTWVGEYSFKVSYHLKNDNSISLDVLKFGINILEAEIKEENMTKTENKTLGPDQANNTSKDSLENETTDSES